MSALEKDFSSVAEAAACDLPAACDTHYLALSDLLCCEFWTADVRLLRQSQRAIPYVRWLGDYAPPDAP